MDQLWVRKELFPLSEDGPTYLKATPTEIKAAAATLDGAERRWVCVNDGDTFCRTETEAFDLDRIWPMSAPHADCGWRLVIPLPDKETT